MAHEYVSWAYKQELKGLLKFTLVALCDRANQEGYCWPSQDDLARMTGQSRRAISNQLSELTRLGYLQVEARRRKDRGAAALLRLVIEQFCAQMSGVFRGAPKYNTTFKC